MDESAGIARRIEASRRSGVLNLRGEGLETVPFAAYDKNAGKAFGNWWEVSQQTWRYKSTTSSKLPSK